MDTLTLCDNDFNEAQYANYSASTKRGSVDETNEPGVTSARDYERLKVMSIGDDTAWSRKGKVSSMKRMMSCRRLLDITIIALVVAVIALAHCTYTLYRWRDDVRQNLEELRGEFVGTTVIVEGPQEIKKNKYITSLSKLQKEFHLQIQVNATKIKNDGKFYNIIHLTECDRYDVRTPGCRIVTIWIRNSTVRVEATVNLKVRVFDIAMVKENQWTTIKIQQRKVLTDYKFRVSVNGREERFLINKIPLDFSNVRVYASDPWFRPQEGSIKNFVLNNYQNTKF